jgi:hypothetical protein
MINKEIFMVHSHELDNEWKPLIEYQSRLDKVIELVQSDYKNKSQIILTWGKATKWIDKRHCDSWMEYLLNLWIPEEIILLENIQNNALETVWEWIFAFNEYHKLFYKSPSINIISSDYHEKRIMAIQKFIFWNMLNKLSFIWVDEKLHQNFTRTEEQEDNSLQAFYNTFQWIEPWNIEDITDRLYTKHPLYSK